MTIKFRFSVIFIIYSNQKSETSSPDDNQELIELIQAKLNVEEEREASDIIEDDDVVDVRRTMENFLNDSELD